MKPQGPRTASPASPDSGAASGAERGAATAGPQPCADLRRMFDDLTREPMPDRLVDLCDKLEDAFHRGELYGRARPRRA